MIESLAICGACDFPAETVHMCCGIAWCPDCLTRHACSVPAVSPGIAAPRIVLRPYQETAVARVFDELSRCKSTLVVKPTGTGKTILFAEVIRRWEHGRVLVVAHRDELIRQAADKIERVTGEVVDIEMANDYADRRSMYDRAKVVVTSVQTMSRESRHARFNPTEFGLVIIDEAHHAVAATYQAVIEHFSAAKILGVTATPDRADELALGRVFESVAFEYDLPTAIDDGWLVPIQQQFVTVESLDLSAVRTVAADLNQGQLAKVMEQEKTLHGVVAPTIELAGGELTLVFTASVDQAERMCEIANRHRPACAEWICGDHIRTPMDMRRDSLQRFSERKIQFLFNCGVLLEGYDEPKIGVVAVARPTKSRSLYAQMIGRGTRPLAGVVDGIDAAESRRAAIASSAKRHVTVLDFVGNSGQHKLVHTADVLGGNFDDEVVAAAERAVQSASGHGERADMLTALRTAEHDRMEAERAKRQRAIVTAKYQTRIVDPFAVWDVLPQREPGWHRGRAPSEKQRSFLKRLGVPEKELDKLSFCAASQLIGESMDRRKKGLCSYKQARVLKRYGLSSDVSFTEASRLMDRLAANGWKPLLRS